MGQNIATDHFSQYDFAQFQRLLDIETATLQQWFHENHFASEALHAGLELEACLVDQHGMPNPINQAFLAMLNSPLAGTELANFNVELNATPFPITGHMFSHMERELAQNWQLCSKTAQQLESDILAIGVLPTIAKQHMTMDFMTPIARYRALNAQMLKLREHCPIHIDIQGVDHLQETHDDIMLESAATSLQIHLQVPQDTAHHFYNAMLLLSAPMVAISANSPYLYGLDLWDETRIAIFEQAVALRSHRDHQGEMVRRVTFGTDYVQDSLWQLFEENQHMYPVALPYVMDTELQSLAHCRLHNGTIWRWNRPLIGPPNGGKPHLRIEHRVMSAGPTVVDIMANIAFFIGATYQLAQAKPLAHHLLAFGQAKDNFYRAAKQSLQSSLLWIDGKTYTTQTLILDHLLPMAHEGLTQLAIDAKDRDRLLGIIQARAETKQHGAAWQRKFIATHGKDFAKMTRAYIEQQAHHHPIHEWSI